MRKNKHNKLKTIARRLLTKKEIKEHTPIFQSNAWNNKKENIKLKVQKRIERIQKTKQLN